MWLEKRRRDRELSSCGAAMTCLRRRRRRRERPPPAQLRRPLLHICGLPPSFHSRARAVAQTIGPDLGPCQQLCRSRAGPRVATASWPAAAFFRGAGPSTVTLRPARATRETASAARRPLFLATEAAPLRPRSSPRARRRSCAHRLRHPNDRRGGLEGNLFDSKTDNQTIRQRQRSKIMRASPAPFIVTSYFFLEVVCGAFGPCTSLPAPREGADTEACFGAGAAAVDDFLLPK